MELGNVKSNSNLNQSKAACMCDRWPERLLRLGCLHDRCRHCYSSSPKTLGPDKSVMDDAVNAENFLLCTSCDGVRTVTPNGPNDESLFTMQPFCMGSATVPRTPNGLPGCELCVRQPDVTPEEAAYFCYDCPINLFCSKCKGTHDALSGSTHRVFEIDGNGAFTIPEHRWARMPAVLCQRHKATCDHWCSICHTAKCKECAQQCSEIIHPIRSTNELDLQGWEQQLRNSTEKLEKAGTDARRMESAYLLEYNADKMELKARKKRVIMAVDNAFDAAEETLNQSFKESSKLIKNFCNCIESAVNCCRLLTQRQLPSHGILLTRAQGAVDFLLQRAQCIVAREEAVMVRLRSSSPEDDLEDVMNRCLGSPASVARQNTPEPTPLYDEQEKHWRDIAVTIGRHVLVAAGKNGMEQVDAGGVILSKWKPTIVGTIGRTDSNPTINSVPNVVEEVVTVDCLEDDRAVV